VNNDESSLPGSRPSARRNTCNGLAEITSERDGRNFVQVNERTEKLSDYRCQGRSVVPGLACDENSEPAEVVGGYAEFTNNRDDCRRTSSEDKLSTRPDDRMTDDDVSNWSDESAWPLSDDKARSCDSLTTLTSDPSGSLCSSAEDGANGRWPVFESSSALSDWSNYTNAGIPCPFDGSHSRENDVWGEDDDDSNEEGCLENVNMPEYTSLDELWSSSDMSGITKSVRDVRRRDGDDSSDIDGCSDVGRRRFKNTYDR